MFLVDTILKAFKRVVWSLGIPPSAYEAALKQKRKKTSVNNTNKKVESEKKDKGTGKKVKDTAKKETSTQKPKGQSNNKEEQSDNKREQSDNKREEIVENNEDLDDIKRFLDNDTSLREIATVKELKALDTNRMNLPTLLPDSMLQFDKNIFQENNFVHLFLYMVVNKKMEYTLEYKNCMFSDEDVDNLLKLLNQALTTARCFFIEFFSFLGGRELKTSTIKDSNTGLITDLKIKIILCEFYKNAFDDNIKMLKLSRYVKTELVNKNKINKSMSKYDIAKVLYNWVVLHVDYEKEENIKQYSGYAAIIKGKAVCQGYTALYNALCRCCGVEMNGMVGIGISRDSGEYENHIWSCAFMNNRVILIDSTWGSPNISEEEKKELKKENIDIKDFCDFTWFDTPYDKFIQEHKWEKDMYPVVSHLLETSANNR
jgi:hypothetical protein